MSPKHAVAVAAICSGFLASAAAAADWPQYRGPKHDGSSTEVDIAKRWPQGEPRILWKQSVGPAFGSFAVAGGKAYLFMERDGKEVLVAMNPDTGKELWATPVDKTIFEKQGGNGPRTTPTVDGDRVYVTGTYFKLACLNAADGKVVWEKDLAKEYRAQNDTPAIKKWGNAASPLVIGDLVIVAGGGEGQAFLAFNKSDGKLAWKTGADKITHATPTPATIHGVSQVIFFTQSGLVAVRTEDGKELWRFPHRFNTSTASSPIVGGKDGDVVFCAAGYGVGGAACKIAKSGDNFSATKLWGSDGEYEIHWSTPVYHDGYLYGIFGHRQLGKGPLKCVELETGKEKWSEPNFGSGGGTVLVGEYVLVQGDKGETTLVKASPEKYEQVGRFQVLGNKAWTMAIYVDGRIYARNDKEAVCIQL
jgi:outer membrane protein assembly factor BamB